MKYYYLISSLPQLDVEDSSLSTGQLDEVIALITRNLTDDDLTVMKCLLHQNDNQNLLYVLFHEYHDFEIRAYNKPSSVPIEVLENYRREYSSLPDYMMNYLNDLSGAFSSLTLREMEQTLNRYFQDHLQKIDNLFLNTFFSWEDQLNQAIANANHKSFRFLTTKNEADAPLFRETLALHGLGEPSELTAQLQPMMETTDLDAIERRVNQYYWQFADSWQEPFSSAQVLAYMVKVIRLYQRKGFTARGDASKSSFERMVEESKNYESSPKMPVI